MKILFVLFSFLFLSLNTTQAQQVYFNNWYDFYNQAEGAWSVLPVVSGYQCKQTNDGVFVIIGVTDIFNTDILLIKTSSLGSIQWQKTYGGAGVDYGYTVDICKDGGYIIGGYTSSYGAGDFDTYIIKT